MLARNERCLIHRPPATANLQRQHSSFFGTRHGDFVILQDRIPNATMATSGSFDKFDTISYSSSEDEGATKTSVWEPPPPPGPHVVRFRLGTRWITSPVKPVEYHYHRRERNEGYLLRLRIEQDSIVSRFLTFLLSVLPAICQGWVRATWPEWFLGPTVVLKLRKWRLWEGFTHEKQTYARLRALQGTHVPVCYGEVCCYFDDDKHTMPGLVLSDEGPRALGGPGSHGLRAREASRMLTDTIGAIASLGYYQDNERLANLHLVGQGDERRIVMVDLEYVVAAADRSEKALSKRTGYSVTDLTERYIQRHHYFVEENMVEGPMSPGLQEDFEAVRKPRGW